MKRLLSVLFAVAAVGAAQALTFDWEGATTVTLGATSAYRNSSTGQYIVDEGIYAGGGGFPQADGRGIFQ